MSLVTFRASDITLPRHVVKLLTRAWYGCSRITEDEPMKPGVLCLLLLSACSFIAPSEGFTPEEYALIWYCVSPEGCERTEEVTPIDSVTITDYFYLHFASTQDKTFMAGAQIITVDTHGWDCYQLHFLTLFGHELEPSKFCFTPAGFEFELSIPNEDPATQSQWVVSGRDVRFL